MSWTLPWFSASTSRVTFATNGMKLSLESPYFYLHMIDEAEIKRPGCISIWGQGALDDTAILRRAIELGGHIRTGLELFYYPARNPTNLEPLQQAQEIAREVGRLDRHENVHEDGPLAGRPPASRGLSSGAACQNRTDDLLITSEMLYQLS